MKLKGRSAIKKIEESAIDLALLYLIKGALSSLRQFLTIESRLKMMKNVFLFHLKSSFCSQDI